MWRPAFLILKASFLIVPALAGRSGTVDTDVDEALLAAAAGSSRELHALARQGGEGAWFALAERADQAGHRDLVRDLRKQSYWNDPPPFARISLTRLLIDDPRSIPRPLAELRRAEERFGSHESLRQARIAVLAALGRRRALVREMEFCTGRIWEAPVLAAAVKKRRPDPAVIGRIERFILHAGDTSALLVLPSEVGDLVGEGPSRLLRARLARNAGRHSAALDDYHRWMNILGRNPEGGDGKEISPVFGEIADSARLADRDDEWAGILLNASSTLPGVKRYASAYHAGRLYRENGRPTEAAAGFIAAAAAAPDGSARDQVLWYRLKTVQEETGIDTPKEMEAFSWAASSWSRGERFIDRLDEFVHRRVRRGEWVDLEIHYRNWKNRWPGRARASAALALAFATAEGRLDGLSVNDYLKEAVEAAPISWPGLRAAGLLNMNVELLPRSGSEEIGESDEVAELLLKWGMAEQVAETVLKSPDSYADDTVRSAARALAKIKPRTSIRIAGLLWRRPGFSPSRDDLLLQHPLPYRSEADAAATAHGIPTEVFYGLVRTESAWDSAAVSRSGAQGLAQFMPATWEEWVRRLRYPQDSNPMDPVINLELGSAYLNWLWEREWTFGWVDTLASYNAGGGRVRTWRRERPGLGDDLFGMSLPIEEPRSYIGKVLSAATLYGYLYAHRSPRDLHVSWGLSGLQE